MPSTKIISTITLATLLIAGDFAAHSIVAFARDGEGKGGGHSVSVRHNGGGRARGGQAGTNIYSESGRGHPKRGELHRCLGNTCGISRAIDNAASKVYRKVKFW